MSLKVEQRLITAEGLTVENAYGRVAVLDAQHGTHLQATVEFYASEEAFLAGAKYIEFNGLNKMSIEEYNRDVDGSDILNIAHDRLIALLASQGVIATKQL